MATAIFDWDGVIIDSHDQHKESWDLLADEEGRELPAGFFKATFGMRNENIIPQFFDWVDAGDGETIARLDRRKEQLYRGLIRRDGIEPLPGVIELLESLKAAGIPCSVGSSTSLENIRTIMEATGLGPSFEAITSAEDVTAGKPAPDVFLKAAEKVGGTPDRSVVFEDAHVGIRAGLSAGMKVIAVATTHPAESLGDADLVFEDLTGVDAGTVLELLS